MLAAMTADRFRAAASLSGSPDQKANAQSQPILVSFDQSDPREFQLRSPVAYAKSFNGNPHPDSVKKTDYCWTSSLGIEGEQLLDLIEETTQDLLRPL
jgi:hypothetical protein